MNFTHGLSNRRATTMLRAAKSRRFIVSIVLTATLLSSVALVVVAQSRVPPHAIAMSVTRTPELIERAWLLPTASTFHRQISWQSNGSRCGPAAVANTYRSLGDAAITEDKVLAGTGRCWFGICFFGLTLDELANIARANTTRKITVLRD